MPWIGGYEMLSESLSGKNGFSRWIALKHSVTLWSKSHQYSFT